MHIAPQSIILFSKSNGVELDNIFVFIVKGSRIPLKVNCESGSDLLIHRDLTKDTFLDNLVQMIIWKLNEVKKEGEKEEKWEGFDIFLELH